ncbi:MAG TPA: Rrf2 family transcriptional regulator [Anaerolineaceae bacterium]|nr:Rrf2 family transcriptional regulator [Anaerolineaceae bacterium]
MSMQITNQADYALRAMLYVARLGPGQHAPSNVIADKMDMSRMFLSRINAQLSNAGLITTRRGASGGIMLAKDPTEITIYDVVSAIDGPLNMIRCTKDPGCCSLGEDCPLRCFWFETENLLVTQLKSTTLADLVGKIV